MEDLTPYYAMIEDCLRQLGVDPVSCRGEQQGQWNLRKGSARLWIDLWYSDNQKQAYFQIMSPIVRLPKDEREAFYEELLRINDKLFGVAFSIHNNWAWMKTIREVRDLDPTEAMAMLLRIGAYADQYDDYLIGRYDVVRPDQSSEATSPGVPDHPDAPPHAVS